MRQEAIAGARTHGTKRSRVESSPSAKYNISKQSKKAISDQIHTKKELVKVKLSSSDSDSNSDSVSVSASDFASDSLSDSETFFRPVSIANSDSVSPSAAFSAMTKQNIKPNGRHYRSRDLENLASILLSYLEEDISGATFCTFMSSIKRRKQEALLAFLTRSADSHSEWWTVTLHLRAYLHDNSRGQTGLKIARSLIKLPYISKRLDKLNISGIAADLLSKHIAPELKELLEPPLFVYKYGRTSRNFFDSIKHWCNKPRQDLANFRCICHYPEFTPFRQKGTRHVGTTDPSLVSILYPGNSSSVENLLSRGSKFRSEGCNFDWVIQFDNTFRSYMKEEMDKWQARQIDNLGVPAIHFEAFRKAFDEEMHSIAHIFDPSPIYAR